ncbi:hypothetical protein FOS14_11235 [Skermania sp. ID1734]|uniref:hypothetical protein n=1 Tax=Skermania sp. ID1734 TaxID=2597516 RepID=UPI00117D987C|nr:hypothetical protein [Skermania sp. ID1734]TSD99810.1 hypothetical protein FOS14_11235 [Skermania sp. ID1734]
MSDSSERLTTLARSAAALLNETGMAWGESVATGNQLTLEGALIQAATSLGDAFVVEREFFRRAALDTAELGTRVLPDAFVPGAERAYVDYLAGLDITDDHLLDHFGPKWQRVLELNVEITSIPFIDLSKQARPFAPVKTVARNTAWAALRDHAQAIGVYKLWLDAQELASVYAQRFLSDPKRPHLSDNLAEESAGWSSAETIARDALASVSLPDAVPELAGELERLLAPWLAIRSLAGDDLTRAAEAHHRNSELASGPAPDDYIPEIDDYDLSLEDPVIDDDLP